MEWDFAVRVHARQMHVDRNCAPFTCAETYSRHRWGIRQLPYGQLLYEGVIRAEQEFIPS